MRNTWLISYTDETAEEIRADNIQVANQGSVLMFIQMPTVAPMVGDPVPIPVGFVDLRNPNVTTVVLVEDD